MIGPASCHHERPGDHGAILIQDAQARLRGEHRSRIFNEGNHRNFPSLAVWLAQPPVYAVAGRGDDGLAPSTPALLRRDRPVSVAIAPLSSQARVWPACRSI